MHRENWVSSGQAQGKTGLLGNRQRDILVFSEHAQKQLGF